MKEEIRVSWSVGPGGTAGNGAWLPDVTENQELLGILVEVGNDGHGAGTHWIERRVVAEAQSTAT